MTRRTQTWRARWPLITIIVAAMVVAEALCRIAVPPLDLPIYASSPNGEDLRLIPGTGGRERSYGRTIFVSVDAAGNRRTVGTPAPGAAAHRLDIIGDSQVFGWGLDDSETIASRLQARLGADWRVVNHGVPGIGPLRYAEELKTVPPSAEVLIVFTEVNDLWDMYGIARYPTECGYLTGGALPRAPLTCFLLGLRLVQLGYAAADTLGDHRALTPLGFDNTSRIAAQILADRVRGLFAAAASAHPHMYFAVVPWNGRFSASARADYFPPSDGKAPRYFEDDFDMIDTFSRAPNPAALFLPHDPHLSPAGAQLFANRIAGVMADADVGATNMRTSGR